MAPFLNISLDEFYVGVTRSEMREGKIVLVAGDHVLDSCQECRKQGVAPGVKVSEAKAILRTGTKWVEFQFDQFRRARDSWLDICCTYSDRIQSDCPHEAVIDLSGHHYASTVAGDLIDSVARHMPDVRIRSGLAHNSWVARQCSDWMSPIALRLGLPLFSDPIETRDYLPHLPLRDLTQIPREVISKLELLGYRRVRDLATTNLALLKQQFGDIGLFIYEIANNRLLDTFHSNYPYDAITSRFKPATPVTSSLDLDRALADLAQDLSFRLSSLDRTARHCKLFVWQEDQHIKSSHRRTHKPMLSTATLLANLRALLGSHEITAPVTMLSCTLSELDVSFRKQSSLTGLTRQSEQVDRCTTALKSIDSTYGAGTIKPASAILPDRRTRLMREWKRATGWM